VNNPLNYVDPNGLDAIAIVFPDYRIGTPLGRVGGLGHAGVLLIDPSSGASDYYEYGRYPDNNCGCGAVRRSSVPRVRMGRDGRPTPASLQSTLAAVSRRSGRGGRISGAYVRNDQVAAMRDAAEARMRLNADPNRQPYGLTGNNCSHFMRDVIRAGGVDMPWMADPRPNSYIDELRARFEPIDYNP
jgi:hypothetical protein